MRALWLCFRHSSRIADLLRRVVLLNVGFSLTLHGSDLLVHRAYLDTKLKDCRFCLTISEFNRRYIRHENSVLQQI